MKLSDTFNQSYRATFWQRDDPTQRLIAWLGDTPPTPSAGGGGYSVIDLPMRSAVTVWQGRTGLLVIDIPIMLWAGDEEPVTGPFATIGKGNYLRAATSPQSTAQQAQTLISMWRPDDDTQPPPVVKVSAPSNLIPYQHLPFWISDFTWGAAIGNDAGDRVMQQLTIQVTEYRADEELQTEKAKKPAKTRRQRVYVVKAGDTLAAIARRYHLRNGWRQLAAAQNPPINDPRAIRTGQRLIIPAS